MAKKQRKVAKSKGSGRFPGESPKYRAAREKLLESEIALRRQIEAVAAERRALPLGGAVKEDYVFEELATATDHTTARRNVRVSQLFSPGKDTLVVYNYMFGPQMAAPCPMCTSMLDSLDGNAQHITQRVNLAVVAKSPIDRILEVARGRGWHNLRLLSSAGNSYNRDYHGENADGGQLPMLNVFTRKNGRIYHAYGSEMLFAPADRGQDGRHVDAIWPLWNVLDFTPEGRGATWYPKLRYD
jgi:predicted dithiol-disulfide oxidoreductase (DUF899 family)